MKYGAEISETGSYPEDNRLRILTPLAKPPKRNENHYHHCWERDWNLSR